MKAAHSLCGEGKLLRAELREAVLGAGLVRVVASAMRAFSEWEPVLTCGCAVLWCHNDGGCQEVVLQAGGVGLVLEALMFGCLSSGLRSPIRSYAVGALQSMLRGPTLACKAAVAQSVIEGLSLLIPHARPPTNPPTAGNAHARDLIVLLIMFLGRAAVDDADFKAALLAVPFGDERTVVSLFVGLMLFIDDGVVVIFPTCTREGTRIRLYSAMSRRALPVFVALFIHADAGIPPAPPRLGFMT